MNITQARQILRAEIQEYEARLAARPKKRASLLELTEASRVHLERLLATGSDAQIIDAATPDEE